ncbi:hypothetical protein Trco_006331 [Trichoderma cornu-damae]|uniref:Zn(2)-C6 fungal-type domain-containing protein n=1 Tax=Trichoderma cornu-damae TaxID=654480 RepID=A0A9P8TTM2_9HYPO|nr:hypothetical protein Trco_006331 [Trichoderma cornu-damae]
MEHVDSTVGPRRKARRSKNGCYTCRVKKVKCDEVRPRCQRCVRLRRLCDYEPKVKHNDLLAMSRGYMLALESSKALPTWAQRAALTRALALPTRLPEFPGSASSLNLSSADHEAIRYFRTTFARIHHTKNPDYSLFSIIFSLAQDEPMVMHALLALGGHEIEFRRDSNSDGAAARARASVLAERDRDRWTPVQHYSAALGLLADAIGTADDGRQLELDPICAVLYLMLVYEQKYGDGTCSGLSNHLAGAALIVKHRCQSLSEQISKRGWQGTPVLNRTQQPQSRPREAGLSLFVIRLLVWIALCDSTAATFGLGGQLNGELKDILGPSDASSIPGFDALHRYSNSLYRSMWGGAYPQVELLDDVENREVFAFLCACMQLRSMVATLAKLDARELRQRLPVIEAAFGQVDQRYGDLLEVASEIDLSTDNSHRLVANIRAFTPIYHAAKLELLRLIRGKGVDGGMEIVPEAHITAIVDLAIQSDKHQGIEATLRVAWPLFVVALETNSVVHRRWILGRFQAMGRYSKNLERAHRFLVEALMPQNASGERRRVCHHDFSLSNGEIFVI